jgi:hypothetical protein
MKRPMKGLKVSPAFQKLPYSRTRRNVQTVARKAPKRWALTALTTAALLTVWAGRKAGVW